MSHWAKINDDNVVVEVVTGNNDDPDQGYDWLIQNLGGTWVQTSYNTSGGVHKGGGTPLHKNYAGVGYGWDGIGFFPPKPYPSWILNSDTYWWEPPKPYPTDDKSYYWDEEILDWVEVV